MVICSAAAVTTIVTGGAAAVPIAAATVGVSAGVGGAAVGTAGAVGTAIGTGAATGAIAGAAATGTLAGAGTGAVAGGTAAGAVSTGAVVGTVATGGLGLLLVGTSINSEDGQITYDCWKPVVHDTSTKPSSGMLLKDMVSHPNVAKVTMTPGICTELPSTVIENIWNEMFEIQYLLLHDTGKIVCHAKPIDA